MNVCHIKFALKRGKEGSVDRNAVGINIVLRSPFLLGISCPVERWGFDREPQRSVLSHVEVLQLTTHIVLDPVQATAQTPQAQMGDKSEK